MKEELIVKSNRKIISIFSEIAIIENTGDALDIFGSAKYNNDTELIIINKESFTSEFFDLKTKIAGDIFQKIVNYGMRLAIYGDFKNIKSKALNDFIYESNNGKYYYFVETKEEAIERLIG